MQTKRSRTHPRRTFLKIAAVAVAGSPSAFSAVARAAAAAGGPLKVGIIGSGRIGGTLGGIWAGVGHEVMFSSLDIEHDKALATRVGRNARAGTAREAAAFGDVLLMAVPYRALPQLGKELAGVIKGKVVIDATNPFKERDGEIGVWAREKGAGVASAELLPGARIVRAFNAVGAARLPEIAQGKGERPGMPMASDDSSAVATASRLVRDAGFEPVLVGPLAMGRHLIPGTPLSGVLAPDQIRKAAASL